MKRATFQVAIRSEEVGFVSPVSLPEKWKAKKMLMPLMPKMSTTAEMSASRFFTNNQPIINNTVIASKNGNPSPNTEMNHHLSGSKAGARQASRKNTAATTFKKIRTLFVNTRTLLDI